MACEPRIRQAGADEGPALFAVFYSAVHQVCSRDYTPAQCAAWAPATLDAPDWHARILALQPLVIDVAGEVVAFADLQADGQIDCFYVHGQQQGRGYGGMLLQALIAKASVMKLADVYSEVSLSAQPFFLRHGFVIEQALRVQCRGQWFDNARMRLTLGTSC
ncbi:GNAT family N-acetyltransferase [Chitinilyticum piscinae]|uniref:GNAT family N-acetyltransferase n=1 Tax=Chitinilyticum piscinae TaxID=2866724 RepID=A0A8J7FP35_9NEIS|nr:GNAT family N-acetyltransferase [Chitinilyticum piscinae]MBE9610426.1 GNAT family N-acetyltransferase [Chitinilyticum piscinae]